MFVDDYTAYVVSKQRDHNKYLPNVLSRLAIANPGSDTPSVTKDVTWTSVELAGRYMFLTSALMPLQ